MNRDRNSKLTLLTGPLTKAADGYVRHHDLGQLTSFLQELLDTCTTSTWRVRANIASACGAHGHRLRACMANLPLWCHEEITKLRSEKQFETKQLKRLLLLFGVLCHEQNAFSVECAAIDTNLIVVIGEECDLHIYASRSKMVNVRKLAAKHKLRCPPNDYDKRLWMTPIARDLNIQAGYFRKTDIGKRDFSVSPVRKPAGTRKRRNKTRGDFQ